MKKINPHRQITVWLYVSAFMVFCMAIIGAITRLTESGLSMVEWRPLIGALPPLSEQEWQRVFKIYQETPEFQKKNSWMEISDFKEIFFWEWFHRFWGRLIGLVYALPLIYFWIRKKIPTGYKPRLFLILILGGMQGVMGWYMVESGLVDRPSVSHFRLAAHLSLAFVIFAALIWTAQDIENRQKFTTPFALKSFSWVVLYMLGITIIWGAYVAGMDAGMVYNEFPLMGDAFLPTDAVYQSPLWVNFFQNPVGIQFLHRWLGVSMLIVIFAVHGFALKQGIKTIDVFMLPIIVLCQVGLGIATLLSMVALPLAALHQAVALILLGTYIIYLRRIS